jgi:hypothetical protein
VLKRSDTTLRKLPTIAPKIKERMRENESMLILIRDSSCALQLPVHCWQCHSR